MTHAIQLLLVDDHTLFRRGLKALLEQDERFTVSAEAGDVGEALRCLQRERPDVILLDNHLPGVRAYQDAVLPPHLPAVAVEAAHPDFWRKYVGRTGAVVGIASFGESAPAKDLYAHFGITAQCVADAVRSRVRAGQRAPHAAVPA